MDSGPCQQEKDYKGGGRDSRRDADDMQKRRVPRFKVLEFVDMEVLRVYHFNNYRHL